MASEPQHDGERHSDLAVMDAQEYKQKRRLERILDDLERVPDTANEAWADYVSGEIERDGRNIRIQHAVSDVIEQCNNMLEEYSEEVENDEYYKGDEDDPLGEFSIVEDDSVQITGLEDFMESDIFFEATVTVPVKRRNKPPKHVTKTVQCTMPETVSRRAYRRLWKFLHEHHGLDMQFEAVEVDEHAEPW